MQQSHFTPHFGNYGHQMPSITPPPFEQNNENLQNEVKNLSEVVRQLQKQIDKSEKLLQRMIRCD